MNIIDSYNKNIGSMSYAKSTDNIVTNETDKNTNNSLKTNNTDSIEIKETNEAIINKKKAYDAFQDACKEIGPTSWGGYDSADMSTYFVIMVDIMKTNGIQAPNFALNRDNIECPNFIDFVDKVKEFATSSLQNKTFDSLPTNFIEFCDKYKENLINYGCK